MSTIREQCLNRLDSNLRPFCDKDEKWNQIVDEQSRQYEERGRLGEEKWELEEILLGALTEDDRKRKQQDLEIVTAKWNIANSKEYLAFNQRHQRKHELRKSLLEDGDSKLAEIEAKIKYYQGRVRDYETEANRHQKELNKLMSEKNNDKAPSGHILTKEELYILRRLLADYSDNKLKEISRRFEENQGGDILREEVENALREKGLTSIADDLKESLEKGVENQKHYEAYESALRGGLALIIRYLKIVLFGPPRSGKSSTLRRLLQEIENLSKDGELSVSTGVAETNDVIIKKLTSETAALPQWRSLKRSKEGGRLKEGDIDDLTQLFFSLISKYTSESKQSADPKATATKKFQYPINPQNPPDIVSINLDAELKAEVSSVTLSEAEEMEIDKAFKKLTAVLRKDSPDDLKQLLEALTLANMIDVGGQPAFLDVLPTLTIGPALYMIFFRLDQDLKKHHTVHFCPADSKDEIQLEDTYRTDEVMCQALSSIVCFSHQPSEKPAESASQESAGSASTHAVIFGTFKDKATDAEISEKEKTIQKKLMSTKLHKEGLLLKTKKGKSFFTVDNMFGTDQSEMAEIRKNIEDIITSKFSALPIPASWLMFRMLLHLLGKPVVSLAQCEEIASRLSMTTPVREAIWFFHHNIGSLMHYPYIPSLKEVVVCNPQVIFDSISKLIIDKLQYSNYKIDQSVIEEFLQKGQFTLSDIDDKTEDHRSDLLSPKQLVDLLKDRNVLAETKHDQEEGGPSKPKFVMPTVLKYASEEELKIPTSTSSKQEAPPLMIHFKSGFVPFGVFCASVANLIARQDSLSPRWQLCGDQVMKNKVKFCIDKSFYATLISRPQYLEIRVKRHPRARSKLSFPTVCSAVRETIVQTLESIIRNIKYRPYAKIKTLVFPTHHPLDLAFTCCLEESHRDHLMQVVKDKGEYYGECLKESNVIGVDLEEEHLIWFNQTEPTTTTSHKQPASTACGISAFQHNAPQNTATCLDQPASTLTQPHSTYGVSEQMVPTLTPSSLVPSGEGRLSDRDHRDIYYKLELQASRWRDIGSALGFLEGELENIQRNLFLLMDSPKSWLREMLTQWLQWAPGDGRGSTGFATRSSLHAALLKVNLGQLAQQFQ